MGIHMKDCSDHRRLPHITPQGDLKFFPNVVLWGDGYVRTFLETTLPTLFASGNIKSLSALAGSEFLIVCPERERLMLMESPQYRRLVDSLPVRFLPLDWDLKEKAVPILNLSAGHRLICEEIAQHEGYAIFLSPDCLVSAGAFQFAVDAARQGFRVVAAPGFRLIKEETEPVLKTFEHGGAVQLSGRDLFALFLSHRHSEMDGYFTDSDQFTRYPHYCFWPFEGRMAMLVRAFHLHPFMVQIRADAALETLEHETIDGDFVGRIVGDFDSIRVVRDVDELVIFSVSPRKALRPEDVPHRYVPSHVSNFANSVLCKPIHRYYFTKPILMQASDVDQEDVALLVEKSGREAHQILSHVRPIQYIGFAQDEPVDQLSSFSTQELLIELHRRIVRSNWRQRAKGLLFAYRLGFGRFRARY
jgi:hypothetical protein